MTILDSWKRMLVGAGIALALLVEALVIAMVITESEDVDYADETWGYVTYALLVVVPCVGAAVGLATRERDKTV